MKTNPEFRAAGLLLDVGIVIPVRPLRFAKKKKPRRLVMRTPCQGSLIRMSREYLSMDVQYENIKDYSFEQNMEFISKHGKTISRMVAYTIVRGYLSGLLFARPVAWWLRWRVHPIFLQEAWFQMLSMLDVTSFRLITASAPRINLMTPRPGREKGS